jgi:hypothetical protein
VLFNKGSLSTSYTVEIIIVATPHVYVLILRTCGFVTLHGKIDFADVSKFQDCEMRLSDELNVSTRVLKRGREI